MAQPEKDSVSGTETTGHEWDGIRELNTPLPRWWLWTFYATVVWGLVYTIVYPAWPTLSAYSPGLTHYSSRMELAETMANVAESRAGWLARFEEASVEEVAADPELLRYAMAGGRVVFGENCAPCHGSGGAGAPGYPVLADDDWLWGGDVASIYDTVRYGVRAEHDETRFNEMPRFGADALLEPAQIVDVTAYVLSLSGGGDDAGAVSRGAEIYAEQCSACHGEAGEGVPELGGPRLADGIWLYGDGGKDAIAAQIADPRHGVMPSWDGRLDDVLLKQVSVYVHALGGGQ